MNTEKKKNNKKIEELEEKININTDEWFLLLYKNLTSQGKREIRNVIKPQLQKGTLSRLRKNTGINFSNLTANPSDEVFLMSFSYVHLMSVQTLS